MYHPGARFFLQVAIFNEQIGLVRLAVTVRHHDWKLRKKTWRSKLGWDWTIQEVSSKKTQFKPIVHLVGQHLLKTRCPQKLGWSSNVKNLWTIDPLFAFLGNDFDALTGVETASHYSWLCPPWPVLARRSTRKSIDIIGRSDVSSKPRGVLMFQNGMKYVQIVQ